LATCIPQVFVILRDQEDIVRVVVLYSSTITSSNPRVQILPDDSPRIIFFKPINDSFGRPHFIFHSFCMAYQTYLQPNWGNLALKLRTQSYVPELYRLPLLVKRRLIDTGHVRNLPVQSTLPFPLSSLAFFFYFSHLIRQ
jgi:hypothetical protein